MTDNTSEIHDENVSLLALLKERRKERNVSFDDIAKSLNVRVKDLEFIDGTSADDIAQYPYLAGLVRSYANFLKIDKGIIDQGIKNIGFTSNVSNKKYELLNIGENLDLKPNKDQFLNFLFISILLFFILLILYHSYEDNSWLIDYSTLVLELAK